MFEHWEQHILNGDVERCAASLTAHIESLCTAHSNLAVLLALSLSTNAVQQLALETWGRDLAGFSELISRLRALGQDPKPLRRPIS
jgi:hypothetical protein